MYILLNDLIFLLILSIFLIITYRRIILNINFFEPIQKRYFELFRSIQVKNYIKEVSRQPVDNQKIMMKETLILGCVLFILFLIGTKAIFFTAVISGSMSPTFDRDDLVLMQNIEHSYKPGDIIMFIDPYTARPYTHRISGITQRGINTAGDAGGMNDPWELEKKDIIGKAIILQGKPVVIKDYGKFFIIDDKRQDFGPLFGPDYRKYVLFIEIIKIYGYVIVVLSIFIYIALTVKQKPWQNK